MRSFFTACILVCLGSSFAFAQTEKIGFPVLKESKQVDMLMDKILDPKNAQMQQSADNPSDVCYLIDLLKNDDKYFSLQIEKNTKPVTNTLLNGMALETDNVGCFEYKKKIIFVWADKSFSTLFAKTHEKKTFDFVYKIANPEPLGNEYFLDIWHYQYKNGHMSVEGPPRVELPGAN